MAIGWFAVGVGWFTIAVGSAFRQATREWVFAFLYCVLGAFYFRTYLKMKKAGIVEARKRPGLCRTCGYDLTGNVSGMCPECGANIEISN